MVHQCYFLPEQRSRLFQTEPYSPFGLEPDVNSSLFENCPELVDPSTRLALVEYAAMLHHWRNPSKDTNDWIGFTSHRQLDKSAVVFARSAEITDRLHTADIVAWYVWDVSHLRHGWLRGAAAQGELASPRLHSFTVDVLKAFGIGLPASYHEGFDVVFANYWAMSRDNFTKFMSWSWPIIEHALALDHPYKQHSHGLNERDHKGKSAGYFMERLFVAWTKLQSLKISRVGDIHRD